MVAKILTHRTHYIDFVDLTKGTSVKFGQNWPSGVVI